MSMTLKSQIESVSGDPAGLERLYRRAVAAGDEAAFKEAIEQAAGEHPQDVLFSAWTYRLDVRATPGVVTEGQTVNQSQTRRWSIAIAMSVALGGLTLLLNVYALIAIASRIYESGLTPNRYAVLGWNTVTLLMLVVVGSQLWRRRSNPWVDIFRESTARVSLLAVAWALWTIIGLPLAFD